MRQDNTRMTATGETRALYDSMSTEELRGLKRAFELDQAVASGPQSIAFGAGRIALIADILARRAGQ
jgi:hypothetical protein